MYKESIKVLDCTIRDGGLINNHQFSKEFVRDTYKAVAASGVDYFEIGYKNSKDLFSPEKYGPWKFCDDDVIAEVIDGIESKTKISVMADIGRVDMDNVKPADQSPVDMVRTAMYVKDVDKAIRMSNTFTDLGYETCLNIMAISRDQGPELDDALKQIEKESKANAVYIVDSFGTLYTETMVSVVKRFTSILKSKEVGFHGHNNQQLAFANTIDCIINGGTMLDATIFGIGRAAGNCPLELLLGFLKNPKFDLRPILDIISKEYVPLREEIEWGYIIPYAIAGMLNDHPKEAMALRESDKKDNYREFYDSCMSQELAE